CVLMLSQKGIIELYVLRDAIYFRSACGGVSNSYISIFVIGEDQSVNVLPYLRHFVVDGS
ncbi:hypothetical protein, partial [Vibrio parahaemolyticus]|uniref:hypothetical protein n=1 Tax=Vibrio parahaemolyticus TaxID=670 RepID=UPI003211993C